MSIFQKLAEAEKLGQAVALCTIVRSEGSTPRHEGTKMLVSIDGRIYGTIGGGEIEGQVIQEAINSLQDRKTRLIHFDQDKALVNGTEKSSGSVEIYIEPIGIKPTLIVVGGGHVGQQVVFLGKWLGYRVILSDERPEFCNPARIQGADDYQVCKLGELTSRNIISINTCFVLATKGSEVDVEGLPLVLKSDAGYIGVIGSKRRWEHTRTELLNKGVKPEELERIHTPIGLDISAESPEEIAVSIMAEIIKTTNTR